MPDIVIHGATSFIGKHLIKRLLSEKIPLVVISRSSSDLSAYQNNSLIRIFRYTDSVNEINAKDIQLNNPVFFEFAWKGVFGSERNEETQLSVNVPLIRDTIQLAHRLNSYHWIGIGSQAEYGNLNKRISETDKCEPTTLYGKAKLECSLLSANLCREYGLQHSWLRLFSVYGPDDNHEWLIQYLIKEMLHGNEVNVTKGEQVWDYLYIDDMVDALIKLSGRPGVGIANIGTGKGVSVRTIIEKIHELTGSNSKINFGVIPYRDDQVMLMEADITKLSSHLDWEPKIDIEEGLKRTVSSLMRFVG